METWPERQGLPARATVIGVTTRRVAAQPLARGSMRRVQWSADEGLVAELQRCGAVVALLPVAAGAPAASLAGPCLSIVDGLLLQGGGDVSPGREAGGAAVDGEGDLQRDDWEFAVLAQARRVGLPVLGICRGLQVLNVARGGSLVRGLEAPAIHDDPALYDGHRHAVRLAPGGWLQRWYGCEEIRVSSAHRHGVGRLGAGLEVEARAPDGLVEAFRANDAEWEFGVQWHPEFAATGHGHAGAAPLLRAFVDAAARFAATRPGSSGVRR